MHSSKMKWVKVILFLAIAVGITFVLCHGLVENSFARLDIHQLENGNYETVILGTSKGACCIEPEVLSELSDEKCMNLCVPPTFPSDDLYLLKYALKYNKINRVIYEVDPGYFLVDDNEDMNYMTIYNAMPVSNVKLEYYFDKFAEFDFRFGVFPWLRDRGNIRRFVSIWKMKSSEPYTSYDTTAVGGGNLQYREHGFLANVRCETQKQPFVLNYDEDRISKRQIQELRKLLKFCERKEIEVVAVTTPTSQESFEQNHSALREADEYFRAVFDDYDIPYYDYDFIDSGFDNSLDQYTDYEGHMWEDAAVEFTKIFADDLQ